MKPYVSLFNKENNERHSSMPHRGKTNYISVYDQNFNSSRSFKKNMDRNRGTGKNEKPVIPSKRISVKETVEEISTKNEIHPVFIINIVSGDNVRDVIRNILNSF